jgi:hypothetical protein
VELRQRAVKTVCRRKRWRVDNQFSHSASSSSVPAPDDPSEKDLDALSEKEVWARKTCGSLYSHSSSHRLRARCFSRLA